MNFTYIYLLFLIGSTIYRIGRLIKSYSDQQRPSRVYFSITYPLMLFLYLTVWCGSIFEYFYFRYILDAKEINILMSGIGFLMYFGVIPLRKWAADTLGKHMSQDIKIFEEHKLIKNGPYRYIRHPLISCAIIEVFGLALIPNSYWTFLIGLFGFMPLMVIRAYLEEKALIEEFKDEYLKYKKEVFAFFPIKRAK
ncbi:MAG: isoprenylcysteine carboxylmethyltransferase family protein [bacterium]